MIKELKELFLNAVSRAFNPIVSSFILSWVIINYKITLVVFDNTPYLSKIDIIQRQLSDPHPTIIYPLIYSLLYSTLIPTLDIIYTYFISKINNIKEYILLRANDIKPYSTQDAKKIFSDLRNQLQTHQNENSELYERSTSEIESLKNSQFEDSRKIKSTTLLYFFRDEEEPIEVVYSYINGFYGAVDDEIINKAMINLQIKHPKTINCLERLSEHYKNTKTKDINLTKEIGSLALSEGEFTHESIVLIFEVLISLGVLVKRSGFENNYHIKDLNALEQYYSHLQKNLTKT